MLSAQSIDHGDRNGRVEQRTNIFVLAKLSSASASGQIKIRNMSPRGALIEGQTLPAVGEQLQLSRCASVVQGRIAWRRAGKAGVRFDGQVEVGDWTPGGSAAQQRVDKVVQQVRTGGLPLVTDEDSPAAKSLSLDLERLAGALDALSDVLAGDPTIVARFGTHLQTLDITSQALRRMSRGTI